MSKMKETVKRLGKPIETVLPELFEKHGNQVGVASELGVTQGTVSLWLSRFGYEQKTILVKKDKVTQ
jgi:predicted transcriptional regulator